MIKTIKRISALLLIGIFSTNSIFAAGFPDEPMVIYGNITGGENTSLEIYDINNTLLKEVSISGEQYGTKKTFNNADKIKLSSFSGELIFKIGNETATVTKGEIASCENSAVFQKGSICEYNLVFETDSNQDTDRGNSGTTNSGSTNDGNTSSGATDSATNFEEIFQGKEIVQKRSDLKDKIGTSIVKNVGDQEDTKVMSKNLDIVKKLSEHTVLISQSKKEALYIPKETTLSEENVQIQTPRKITNIAEIKSSIQKEIIGAVEIPTNKQITFDKPIRVCTNTSHNNSSGLTIFYSHDNINWTLDTSASQLEVSNGQVCFNVDHLTSFAVGYEVPPTNTGGSSSSRKKDNCPDGDYTKSRYDKKCGEKEIENPERSNDNTSNETASGGLDSFLSDILSYTEDKEEESDKENIQINDQTGEITIDSKSYIRNLKRFNAAKKKAIIDSGYSVVHIQGDSNYNKKIEKYTAKIFQDIQHPSIRESMFKHMNRMSTSYGIYYDKELDSNLKATYKEKLKKDILEFEFKIKKLKIKDMIVRNTLEKRRLRELEKQKND